MLENFGGVYFGRDCHQIFLKMSDLLLLALETALIPSIIPSTRDIQYDWLTFARFNWAVRKLHKRLVQLGATEAYPRGEADEQHPEGYI